MRRHDEFALAAEFPTTSRQQWQRLVGGVLAKSGKPGLSDAAAEEALATEVEEGLWVQALYTAQDTAFDSGKPGPGWPGIAPFTRGGRAAGAAVSGWDVRQRHAEPDPGRMNAAVRADLDNGVTSLWLTLGGTGLPVKALPDALADIDLARTGIVLDAGAEFPAAAQRLLALYDAVTGPGRAAVPAGNLGADPLGLAARAGGDALAAAQLAEAAALAARCAVGFPALRAIVVDLLPYRELGATAAQELGLSLSTAVTYLRELTAAGLSADAAAGQLEFRYAATADQFLMIAKLRAARRLWSRVAGACGIDLAAPAGPAAQRQHAVTAAAAGEPHETMLRATVACLAAGVGGADAVTVLPIESGPGWPADFADRIARNTQAILLEEANLHRVVDPAGGSWYVERLTDELARAAWAFFQDVERAGGHLAALRSGMITEFIPGRIAKNTGQKNTGQPA